MELNDWSLFRLGLNYFESQKSCRGAVVSAFHSWALIFCLFGDPRSRSTFLQDSPQGRICTPLTLQYRSDSYFIFLAPGPAPGLDRFLSNQGKTAYVYPAYELSLFLQTLA